MAEIDVLKIEQQLRRTRLKRVLSKKEGIISLSIAAASIPTFIITNNNALQALSAFIIGFKIQEIKRLWNKEKAPDDDKVIEFLRTTKTYEECQKEYQTYITEVANLIRKLNFPSSKDAILYLQLLLETGHFSKYMNHKYKMYSEEKEYLIELCGAKVTTGTTVCRHQASFFTDVLNEIGYTAATISVVETSSKDPVAVAKKYSQIKWNHAVTSVSENGRMYLFDPTRGKFAAMPSNINKKELEAILVGQIVGEPEPRYFIMNPHSKIINYNREKQLTTINASKMMTISSGEYEFLKNKAELVYKGNSHNQFKFFQEQEKRREKIAQLYQELCPYGDKSIKKWIVRK